MKIFRPLAAVFLVSTFALAALAQDSSEIASLRAKAEKGNAIAQYNLGLAYAQGRGIAADPVEAYVWLSLARENGARGRALDCHRAPTPPPSRPPDRTGGHVARGAARPDRPG